MVKIVSGRFYSAVSIPLENLGIKPRLNAVHCFKERFVYPDFHFLLMRVSNGVRHLLSGEELFHKDNITGKGVFIGRHNLFVGSCLAFREVITQRIPCYPISRDPQRLDHRVSGKPWVLG